VRALIIKKAPLDKILAGTKTWEMRGSRTNIRETIGLIESGSGTVVGLCDLMDCRGPLTAAEFRQNARKAGMAPAAATLGGYAKTYAWVLANARRLKTPVPYNHPSGAIIWVALDESTERALNGRKIEKVKVTSQKRKLNRGGDQWV